MRVPKRDTARSAHVWQRRFADCLAFVLSWNPRGEPALEELAR